MIWLNISKKTRIMRKNLNIFFNLVKLASICWRLLIALIISDPHAFCLYFAKTVKNPMWRCNIFCTVFPLCYFCSHNWFYIVIFFYLNQIRIDNYNSQLHDGSHTKRKNSDNFRTWSVIPRICICVLMLILGGVKLSTGLRRALQVESYLQWLEKK